MSERDTKDPEEKQRQHPSSSFQDRHADSANKKQTPKQASAHTAKGHQSSQTCFGIPKDNRPEPRGTKEPYSRVISTH